MKRFLHILHLFTLPFLTGVVAAHAQTLPLQIDSSIVSSSGKEILLKDRFAHATRVDVGEMAVFPSLLGNADPIRFAQMLPSTQSSSELDAGIHIQGCDHQHNLVSLQTVNV